MTSIIVFRVDEILMGEQRNISNNITEYVHKWSQAIPKGLEDSDEVTLKSDDEIIIACRDVYHQGCLDNLATWLRHTADMLFIFGYCVLAFLKLFFLGILRYEIKEMIQKIKLLQAELNNTINTEMCELQAPQV